MKLLLLAVVCCFFLRPAQAQVGSTLAPPTTPQLHEAEDRLIKDLHLNYNKKQLPAQRPGKPVKVELGLTIISIREVDAKKQSIEVDCWLKKKWKDVRLQWDADKHHKINVLRMAADDVWKPDVTLYNSQGYSAMTEFAVGYKTAQVLVYGNGDVIWIPAATLKTNCDIDLTYFPFDSHNCTFKFGSWVHDGNRLDLELYGDLPNKSFVDMSDFWDNGEWIVESTSAVKNNKYYSCCEEPYPDITFTVLLRRNVSLYHTAILFPIAACIIMAVFAFLIPPFRFHRMQMNAFLLFLFVLLLFRLLYQFPSVGRHTPAVVSICECFIILVALSIVWNIMIHIFVTNLRGSQPSSMAKWFLNVCPVKGLFWSAPADESFQLQECAKEVSVNNQSNKDPEVEAIVPVAVSTSVTWLRFFTLLDRLAFIFFTIIAIAIIIAFSH